MKGRQNDYNNDEGTAGDTDRFFTKLSPMPIEQKHKGARAEMIACIWLLNDGYEVFRNVSAHGLADIVAIKGDEVLKVDVKSSTKDKPYSRRLDFLQIKAGVVPLVVGNNGSCRIYRNAGWYGDRRLAAEQEKERRAFEEMQP